jgi:hypothetical protein
LLVVEILSDKGLIQRKSLKKVTNYKNIYCHKFK